MYFTITSYIVNILLKIYFLFFINVYTHTHTRVCVCVCVCVCVHMHVCVYKGALPEEARIKHGTP
jgi:hypothetical protein